MPANKSISGQVTYSVGGAPATIAVAIEVTDVAPVAPNTPTVTRAPFDVETPPALDVAWTLPVDDVYDDIGVNAVKSYELQYRKQGDAEWTSYGGSLGAGTTGLRLPSLEPGATYKFHVRADTTEGISPWSGVGRETANNPPELDSPIPDQDVIRGAIQSMTGVTDYFTDLDEDLLRIKAVSEYPDLVSVSAGPENGGTLEFSVSAVGQSRIDYTAHDGYGGVASGSFNFTAAWPSATRQIAERSPAGTPVGDPVTDLSNEGESLTYSLAGEVANAFVIDPDSGQLGVKSGAALDYETKSSYAGQVTYTLHGVNLQIVLTPDSTHPR